MNITQYRARIAERDADLARRYWNREDIGAIVADRVAFFDGLIREIWHRHFNADDDVLLFAVGGYARRELHPGSDIDLLILGRDPRRHKAAIEAFLRNLYDLNLEIGHSVRTVRDCAKQAAADITVATALFERHALTEPATNQQIDMVAKLDRALSRPKLWPADQFFRAKRDEQEQRHRRFQDVEYNLEPDIKASPGGLRDLQTVLWVCGRKFGSSDIGELENLGVVTRKEREWLENGRRYLWWVRYGLHLVAGRKDDRLQFEYQRSLAQRLGYVDTAAKLGVERFMHQYYRYVLSLREVNDIVLQFLEESFARRRPQIETVNDRFRIRDNHIEAVAEDVFARHPSALLELFVILANRRGIDGVRAATIRLIRAHVHLIDDEFRANPENNRLFIALLKAPHSLVTQLTRMRRYGILARYIPEFGDVVGQMQHDLFHIYTVDAHTMMVIRQMRLFRYRAQAETYPLAHRCVESVPKIELLYIAGLYHDIGKGRGGDHSQLGATDAVRFCRRHGLNEDDTALVEWLVEHHLLMSSTAQRQDIYDPDVVFEFAKRVRSEQRLDYLYALTVADITATNPTLWNSWRHTLLQQLYTETRKLLEGGMEAAVDKQASIRACLESTAERLAAQGVAEARAKPVWALLGNEFLLRHTPERVADVTVAVLGHDADSGPLVLVRNRVGHAPGVGATEVFVYTHDRPNLFAASVIALDRLHLSVYDANIRTSEHGLCFNTYVVLDAQRQPVRGERDRLVQNLTKAIAKPKFGSLGNRRVPRRLRQLSRPTETSLVNRDGDAYSTLTVLASDRPGLLARIGLLFHELRISVLGARITTLGERVEDAFYLQTRSGEPITDPEFIYTLENTLRQTLDAAPD